MLQFSAKKLHAALCTMQLDSYKYLAIRSQTTTTKGKVATKPIQLFWLLKEIGEQDLSNSTVTEETEQH